MCPHLPRRPPCSFTPSLVFFFTHLHFLPAPYSDRACCCVTPAGSPGFLRPLMTPTLRQLLNAGIWAKIWGPSSKRTRYTTGYSGASLRLKLPFCYHHLVRLTHMGPVSTKCGNSRCKVAKELSDVKPPRGGSSCTASMHSSIKGPWRQATTTKLHGFYHIDVTTTVGLFTENHFLFTVAQS